MKHIFHMHIAGVHFTVRSRYPITAGNLAESYKPFLFDAPTPASDLDININIETGRMPDTGKMTRIFDTEQSWTLFRRRRRYFLRLNVRGVSEQPVWLAVFDSACDRVALYCSDNFLAGKDGDNSLSAAIGYPLDQLLIMHMLAAKGGILIHSAGLGMEGRGCVFPGRSGAGKSTLSRIFSGRDRVCMLSDDRMIIRKSGNGFIACGTPWAGDAGIAENRGVALNGIFFIHHAGRNMIRDLHPKEAVKRLMPVLSVPWYDKEAIGNIFSFCGELAEKVPAYELHFRPEQDAAAMLEAFVSEGRT